MALPTAYDEGRSRLVRLDFREEDRGHRVARFAIRSSTCRGSGRLSGGVKNAQTDRSPRDPVRGGLCGDPRLTLGATAGANAASPQTSPSAQQGRHRGSQHTQVSTRATLSQRGHTAARPHVAAGPLVLWRWPCPAQPQGVSGVSGGSQWNSDGNGVQSYLTNYFSGLGTSSDHWSTVTSQYTDNSGSGPAFNGSVLGGTWVDNGAVRAEQCQPRPTSPTRLTTVPRTFGVSGSEVNIFVVSPSGTSPDGFPNTGFLRLAQLGRQRRVHQHAVRAGRRFQLWRQLGAEPARRLQHRRRPRVRRDGDRPPSLPAAGLPRTARRNGDLCAWMNLSAISLPTGSFAVQPTWSNAVGGCASSA